MSIVGDRIRRLAEAGSSPGAPVRGHWFSIQYRPSLLAGEALNIGVGFVNADSKRVQLKSIASVNRVASIFGERVGEEIKFALQVVECCIQNSVVESPSENIRFSEPRFASGQSADEILEQVFATTVRLLSVENRTELTKRTHINNGKARAQVFDAIRLQAGLNAERILAERPLYIASEQGREYTLDIPLQGTSHLGSVVSVAASCTVLERNLLRACVDLEIASQLFKKDKLGLFLLRGRVDAVGRFDPEIENVIDLVGWKLRKQHIVVEVEDAAPMLAKRVLAWCGV